MPFFSSNLLYSAYFSADAESPSLSIINVSIDLPSYPLDANRYSAFNFNAYAGFPVIKLPYVTNKCNNFLKC